MAKACFVLKLYACTLRICPFKSSCKLNKYANTKHCFCGLVVWICYCRSFKFINKIQKLQIQICPTCNFESVLLCCATKHRSYLEICSAEEAEQNMKSCSETSRRSKIRHEQKEIRCITMSHCTEWEKVGFDALVDAEVKLSRQENQKWEMWHRMT